MTRPDFTHRPFDVLDIFEVHDGDTYLLLLDQGFRTYAGPWLRLEGFSAPELRIKDPATQKMVDNPPGIAARDAAAQMLRDHLETAWVITRKLPPDLASKLAHQYGDSPKALTRYVGDVWLADDLRLGDALVAADHARPGAFIG